MVRNVKRGGKRKGAANVAPLLPETLLPPEPSPDNPFDLTAKELLFVEAYCGVASFSAAKAYAVAGYKGSGSVQRSNACRLLANDRVSAAIADRLGARVQRLRIMDGDEALERITNFARADIGDLLSDDDPLKKLPEDVRRRIKSIRPTKFGRVLELYDAMHANELMAKATGKLKEVVRVERTQEDLLAEVNELERARGGDGASA